MIQDTQLEAYKTIKDKSRKRHQVYKAISSYCGLTLFELVDILGWEINKITGRVNELVKNEKVKDSGLRRVNPKTKKSAIVWICVKESK